MRMHSWVLWCVCVVGLGLVAPAAADQEPLPLGSIKEPAQGSDPVDLRKQADPGADRSLVFPSAETLNKGDVTLNSYQLLGLGFSYGVTDWIELSASTLLPALEDVPLSLYVSGKFQLVRTPSLLFSVQGNAGALKFLGDEDGYTASLGVGLLLDVILDQDGDLVLSLGNQNLWNYIGDAHTSCSSAANGNYDCTTSGESVGVFALSVAFNARVAKIVKLLFEVVIPGAWDSNDFELVEEATVFNYGVRFFGESIAVDLSFLRPIHPDIDLDYFVMGVPYLAFSARF